MKFGLLLPHFGSHVDTSRLLEGAVRAERLGFDSVWVRDHIVYWPHTFEDPNPTWLDPFIVLTAIAAKTSRLTVGTATLIPHRHPIDAAQLLSSLATIAGSAGVIAAWGRGNDDREFKAVGAEVKRRGQVLEEQIEIIRALWTGDPVDHSGSFYTFSDVRIASPGLEAPVAHWYGGGSLRAIDRVARFFDGWLASRIPRSVLKTRIHGLRQLSLAYGRERPTIGLITLVSPDERGPGIRLDVERLVQETARRYPEAAVQDSGDLDGVLISGGPSRILDEVLAFQDVGVDHFIFDLRAHFDEWEDCIKLIGTNVLPVARSQSNTP